MPPHSLDQLCFWTRLVTNLAAKRRSIPLVHRVSFTLCRGPIGAVGLLREGRVALPEGSSPCSVPQDGLRCRGRREAPRAGAAALARARP